MTTAHRGSSDEDIIKARAYAIWEDEGRPHGRDVDHWLRASQEVTATNNKATPAKSNGAGPAARRTAKTATPEAARAGATRSSAARTTRPSRPDTH